MRMGWGRGTFLWAWGGDGADVHCHSLLGRWTQQQSIAYFDIQHYQG